MANEQGSILSVSIRAFLRTFFAVLGIVFALFALILFFGLFSTDPKKEPTAQTKPKVLFNPDGTKTTLKSESPLLLQININGVIGMGSSTIEKIRTLLDESQTKPLAKGRVKGIFLNVNSPGGGAFDSDAIYRLLTDYKKKYQIPIYTYTEHVMASGGYYIGVAGDKIFSSPVGIIGSVGVIVPTVFNFSKVLQRFDIETLTISDGKYKDALNPLRPWTAEDKEYLKPMINYFYDTFLTVVSENRPALTKDVLMNQTGAKVFAPPMAKELGYIDEIVGTQKLALEALAEAAGLKDKTYQVVVLEQASWWEDLFSEDVDGFSPFSMVYQSILFSLYQSFSRGF